MGRKLVAPAQWVRSLLLIGAIAGLMGSSGCCGTCGIQGRRQKQQPFNPGSTFGSNGTNSSVPGNYSNLPQGTPGQGQTGQTGQASQAPIDPTGKAGWGQNTPGSPGLGSPTSGSPMAPSSNTTHYVPSQGTIAPQAPESVPPGRQTAQYGVPSLPPPSPPSLPVRSEDGVRPLPVSQVLGSPEDSRSQTTLSRPGVPPSPPSDPGLSQTGGNTLSLPRLGSVASEPQPSDPQLVAPPPTLNRVPQPLPPG